jgi:hypothetical protein
MKLGGRNAAILVGAVIIVGCVGIWLYTDSMSRVDETSLRIYADPMTENILTSIDSGDLASMTRNMDNTMKAAYTPETFESVQNLLHNAVGTYGTKTFVSAQRSGDYIVVFYKATYSNEPAGVTVKVVFTVNTGGPALVSGLWFSSPKLAG